MELYEDILAQFITEDYIERVLPRLEARAKEIVEMKCYQALRRIKAVIEDERLTDPVCFMKIEEIIRALEGIGSNGGSRHDFV